MLTTSEPAFDSLIASAPTCSPLTSRGQVFLLLRLAAVAVDLVDAQVGVRAVRQPDRGRGPRHLFHRDDVRQVAEFGAAVFLLHGHAVQAERSEFLPEIGREQVVAVDRGGPRRDLVGSEGLDRVAQGIDGVAEVEVQAGVVHGWSLLESFLQVPGGRPRRRATGARERSLRRVPLHLAPQWLQIAPPPDRPAMLASPLAKQRRAATPMAFVRAIVGAYARYAMDPSAALAQAQIMPRELADPKARVTAAQFEALSGFAMQELDDEALGWFSRRLPWGSYGMLCRPRSARRTWAWRSSAGAAITGCWWTTSGSSWSSSPGSRPSRSTNDARSARCASSAWSRCCASCSASPAGRSTRASPWPVPSFRSRRRRTRDAYPLLFGGALRFGAARAGCSFDARYLALPLQRDERALRTMLKRAPAADGAAIPARPAARPAGARTAARPRRRAGECGRMRRRWRRG